MIRWATEADRPVLVRLMQHAKMGCEWYDYGNMDGWCLVDEVDGDIRGYVRFDLGSPETHVRQIVVAVEHQGDGLTMRRLLAGVVGAAKAYGSQGVEGFQPHDHPELEDMVTRAGAYTYEGVRVRWPLTSTANAKAAKWQRELLESGPARANA